MERFARFAIVISLLFSSGCATGRGTYTDPFTGVETDIWGRPVTYTQAPAEPIEKLHVESYEYDTLNQDGNSFVQLRGVLKNVSGKSLYNIGIVLLLYDQAGRVVQTERQYIGYKMLDNEYREFSITKRLTTLNELSDIGLQAGDNFSAF